MKNKILILGITISGLAFAQLNDQCIAFTTKGKQCKIKVDFKLSNTCHHSCPSLVALRRLIDWSMMYITRILMHCGPLEFLCSYLFLF